MIQIFCPSTIKPKPTIQKKAENQVFFGAKTDELIDYWKSETHSSKKANVFLSERELIDKAKQSKFTVVSPHMVLIDKRANISEGTVIMPFTWILGNVSIGKNSVVGPFVAIGPKSDTDTINIGDNSRITLFSTLEGNPTVGNNVTVGPHSRLREDSIIKDNAKIGFAVEVQNSTIGEYSKAQHMTGLENTTVGKHVNIGGLSCTSTYNPFNKTNRTDVVIGDNSNLGANVILEGPLTLPNKTMVASKSFIRNQDLPSPYISQNNGNELPEGSLLVSRPEGISVKPGWYDKQVSRSS